MDSDIGNSVTAIITEVLPRNKKDLVLSGDLHLQSDLAMDSMSLATMAYKLEAKMGIDIDDLVDNVGQMGTINDVVTVVQKLKEKL